MTATLTPLRVAEIIIREGTFKTTEPADQVAVLWRFLDRCVVPAEQRANARVGGDDTGNIPAALVTFDVRFPRPWPRPDAPVIGPMTTDYPALARSLQVLSIERNNHDESATLGPFAALATQLQELRLKSCGLTSLQGLEGHCESLQMINLMGCENLSSLEGLGNREHLTEANASGTGIASIEPLRTCPALTKVYINGCEQLSSIEALAARPCLQEVNASGTAITSIEPLRTCPALTVVNCSECERLKSVEALADHRSLTMVWLQASAVTSVAALLTCPALVSLYLEGCENLSGHVVFPSTVRIM